MFDSKEFGVKVKSARELKNMKQSELAEKMGVSVQTISAYETGKKIPPLDNAAKICEELNISLDDLLGIPPVEKTQPVVKTLRDLVNMLETAAEAMRANPQSDIENHTCWLWITDPRISAYYEKKEKMLRLLNDETINDDLYSSWYWGEMEKLSKEKPLVEYGELPFAGGVDRGNDSKENE